MLEIYIHLFQIFIIALAVFSLGLSLKEIIGLNLISAISIIIIFTGLTIFLTKTLLNSYFNLEIIIIEDFPGYLAKQFGGFVLALIFGEVYKKNFVTNES